MKRFCGPLIVVLLEIRPSGWIRVTVCIAFIKASRIIRKSQVTVKKSVLCEMTTRQLISHKQGRSIDAIELNDPRT